MVERKRSLNSAAVVVAVFLAAMGTAIGFGAPAAGQGTNVTGVSGRAFGLQATGILAVDPTPEVVLPSGGGNLSDELAEVDLSPLLTAGLLRVGTEGQTGPAGFAESSATVLDVRVLGTAGDVADPVLDLGGVLDLDQLLGGSGLFIEVLESECRANAQAVQGSTTIVGINEEGVADPGNTLTLGPGESLDIDLGPLVRVVLNEQQVTQSTGYKQVIVNGARVTLLGNDGNDINADPDALLDVILSRSECDVRFTQTSPPPPPPPPPPIVPGPDAGNESNVSNHSSGTAVVETGDATAVGNHSSTEINQSATATGGSGAGGGGHASVDQDATVVNAGQASANTGGNTAVGNSSTNVAVSQQQAVAVGGEPGGGATATNSSHVSNSSNGAAVVSSGNASAVGNHSSTGIDQSANATGGSSAPAPACTPQNPCTCTNPCTNPCPPTHPCQPCPPQNPCQPCTGDPCQPCTGDPCQPCGSTCPPQPCGGTCWGGWGGYWRQGGSASSNQSATVVNSGSGQANTGGNTAVGNNSTNVASNDQTAVAAG